MSEGWIKLHRSITENRIWDFKPFSWAQAWIDMILLANHKTGYIWVRHICIKIDRGQLGWSQRKMAVRWGWSRKAVQTFLKWLETEQQIEPQKNNLSSVITIVNYEKYQSLEPQLEPQESHKRATEEPQRSTNKNDKNERMKEKSSLSARDLEFLEFWEMYPKKVGKQDARTAWTKHCNNGELAKIKLALPWQSARDQWKQEDGRFIPNPGTYLRQHRWEDQPPVQESFISLDDLMKKIKEEEDARLRQK